MLYWLSGLTCTDENFIIKSGAQRAAAAHGLALVAPDTSPRMWTLNPCSHSVLFLGFTTVHLVILEVLVCGREPGDYELRISLSRMLLL